MSKGLTEIVYILDRSGSMEGLEKDTIGGFNSMMEKQKNTGGNALVSTVLFDDEIEILHDRILIEKVEKMTDKQYFARGCTALLDAVGMAIDHIGKIHKNASADEKPDKTIFIITTDGLENASCKYSYEKIKEMVNRQQKKYGWEFIFIGANIDAYDEAGRFGISRDYAVNYHHDAKGVEMVYKSLGKALCHYMDVQDNKSGSTLAESNWREEIDEDFENRS